ncbi:MAG: YqeG family HAD IIIA-type phosphatase [Bacilli bacterium]
MNKLVIPTYYAKSLFEVDILFFKKNNIHYLFTDLDNTLDSFKQKEPTDKVIALKKLLIENDIELIIISNNKGPRVSQYADALGVRYLSKAGKPFPSKIRKYMASNKIKAEEVIMVGDQLMTDIKSGNGAHIKTMLTEPIVQEDQWQTRFNRMFDKPVRKRLKTKNLLNDWRNY